MIRKVILFSLALFFSHSMLNAQCSDAGICSIGGHGSEMDEKPFSIGATYRFGIGEKDDDITFSTIDLSAGVRLADNIRFDVLVPVYKLQSGKLADVSGIGDVIALFNYDAWTYGDYKFALQAGMKFATGADDAKVLPQVYQPGLGTNDVLLGITIKRKSYMLAIGYQLVEDTFNNNELFALKRGDDLYTRFTYNWTIEDFRFSSYAMYIQRLEKSEIIDYTLEVIGTPPPRVVEDSDQAQVNLGTRFSYPLNKDLEVTSEVAFPLLKRDNNTDGLTRALTISAGIAYTF
jgi:hypothetical protein